MSDTQLQKLVDESGLDSTKANFILKTFEDSFAVAAEWELKAKNIVVTNSSQKDLMLEARNGRLFLKAKRNAIEKNRKLLKEQSLREGKAIDGIANVLKGLIVPLEQHLEKQEKFVEILEARQAESYRLQREKELAEQRAELEEAAREERERIAKENAELKTKQRVQDQELEAQRLKAAELEESIAKEQAESRAFQMKQEAKTKQLAKEKEAAEAKNAKLEKALREKTANISDLPDLIKCPNCQKWINLSAALGG